MLASFNGCSYNYSHFTRERVRVHNNMCLERVSSMDFGIHSLLWSS